ncbi:MAG: hypothetical protein PHO56_04600 [Patescibacteria group bacterium]|nr:hypothetical protein [Patescibacteria group bacterium]
MSKQNTTDIIVQIATLVTEKKNQGKFKINLKNGEKIQAVFINRGVGYAGVTTKEGSVLKIGYGAIEKFVSIPVKGKKPLSRPPEKNPASGECFVINRTERPLPADLELS